MYIMQSPPGPRVRINGKIVDYFSGCGYYDLQGRKELITEACAALEKYGISSATSPLAYGNNPVLQDLQTAATEYFESENILYFVSAIQGSCILLEGLKDSYDIIFVDRESHYSILNAVKLPGKPVITFSHMDPGDLKEKCANHVKPGNRPLVICDGIFPISGELAPLPDYWQVLKKYHNAVICVDDAHATGVVGPKGHGTFEYFGMKGDNFFSSGTLSKALGGHGGIIAGSQTLIDTLNRGSNTHHSSSPVPIPAIAATTAALKLLKNQPLLRQQLWDNVKYAKAKLRAIGFKLDDSPVPIICLHNKEKFDFKALQLELFKRDIAVTYLPGGRYTSVPPGGAIRLSIFSSHSRKQIDHLSEMIQNLV